MGKGIGWVGVATVAAVVWVVAQAETENPGAVNRATNSGASTLAGVVADAGVVLDEVRAQAGGLASDLGGAVEGRGGSESIPSQPQLPVQVQPRDEQG